MMLSRAQWVSEWSACLSVALCVALGTQCAERVRSHVRDTAEPVEDDSCDTWLNRQSALPPRSSTCRQPPLSCLLPAALHSTDLQISRSLCHLCFYSSPHSHSHIRILIRTHDTVCIVSLLSLSFSFWVLSVLSVLSVLCGECRSHSRDPLSIFQPLILLTFFVFFLFLLTLPYFSFTSSKSLV